MYSSTVLLHILIYRILLARRVDWPFSQSAYGLQYWLRSCCLAFCSQSVVDIRLENNVRYELQCATSGCINMNTYISIYIYIYIYIFIYAYSHGDRTAYTIWTLFFFIDHMYSSTVLLHILIYRILLARRVDWPFSQSAYGLQYWLRSCCLAFCSQSVVDIRLENNVGHRIDSHMYVSKYGK